MTAGNNEFGLSPGDVLEGRFRLEELLGEGGFGAVFRATQLNIDRQVAIKVVLPQLLATPELLERFMREAQVAQRLEHPNTVRMYDFGYTENGVPYIAWELLKGRPLDLVIAQEGMLSAERVARITMQVLKALMEAHAQGVVHRDIKPANIFLSDFQGEPDFVKVLDFGIAKALDATDADGPMKNLTVAGQIIGTPNYMSPEQVEGKPVGPKSDLYALGLVMAEMMTGRAVLEGTGLAVCAAHLSPDPIAFDPIVHGSPLAPIVLRATQKKLEERHESAREMFEEIREVARAGGLDTGMLSPSQPGFTASPEGYSGSQPGYSSPASYPTGPTGVPVPPSSNASPAPSLTPQPAVNPIAKSGGSSRLLFLLVGVLGTLVVLGGLVIAVMAFLLVDDDDSSSNVQQNGQVLQAPGGGTPGYTYPGATENPPPTNIDVGPSINRNLALVTPDLLRRRIQAAGYRLMQEPIVQEQSVVRTVAITALRGQTAASVVYYDYQMSFAVSAMAASFRQQPGAVANDTNRLIYVRAMSNDANAESQRILNILLQ